MIDSICSQQICAFDGISLENIAGEEYTGDQHFLSFSYVCNTSACKMTKMFGFQDLIIKSSRKILKKKIAEL